MIKNLSSTIKELLLFSLPIIAGQIGQMLFGVVDIAVGGRYSSDVVSALGVGGSFFSPFLVFGLGIAFQIGPMTAQRIKKKTLNDDFFYSGFFINLLLGLILSTLFFFTPSLVLTHFDFPQTIIPMIKAYTFIITPSLLFSILFQNHKEYLQAFEKTFFANSCIIFFNVVNLFLNIALMFGKWGLPEMGIVGAGISTLVCRSLMFIVLHIYICKVFNFKWFYFSTKYIKEIVKEGLPVSFGITAEVFMFSITSTMAGTMGIITSAAHNICLNLGALTFMVPMALSSAAAVKVGHTYALNNIKQLKKYIGSVTILVFIFMVITCLSYFSVPGFLLSYATDQPAVLNIGIGLMFYVALFQIPDGLQIMLQGVLRGMSVTSPTMWITIITCLFCVPISYLLAFKTSLGAKGLWLSLSITLTIQAFCYFFLLRKKLKAFENTVQRANDQNIQ